MWICDNEGFLSIVENRNDDETLLVRARTEKHLLSLFPDCELFTDASADYPYRAYIDRQTVADTVAIRLLMIDYDNFKASVNEVRLHDAYNDMWRVLWHEFYPERELVQ